jgi:cytochrome c biogenesis protein CcdA
VEIQLILISFIAGVLTILAPCIFPLLPILIGTSADGKANRNRAFTVIVSLLVSIIVLTLLIYGTSNVLGINEGVLRVFSAIIIISIGLVTLFPHIWESFSAKFGLGNSSNRLLGRAMKKDGKSRDILIGASLGPVFSSCSPTYGLIIATILPQDFATGTLYLLWYVFGLGLMFFLIAVLGQKITSKLTWAVDPNGWFKRSIGALFLIIGVAIIFNLDKSFETWLLQFEFYDSLVNFELQLNK